MTYFVPYKLFYRFNDGLGVNILMDSSLSVSIYLVLSKEQAPAQMLSGREIKKTPGNKN